MEGNALSLPPRYKGRTFGNDGALPSSNRLFTLQKNHT